MTLDLASLAVSFSRCNPEEPDSLESLCRDVAAATAACEQSDTEAAESLLKCVLESLASAGDRGKAILDGALLELLPPLASLAPRSQACCAHLSSLCMLAVSACSARDTITVFLELLDNLVSDGHGPAALQFLFSLMSLLPQQLSALSRRKAAFAGECCVAVAALARAHAEVLSAWAQSQLALAASGKGGPAGTPSITDAADAEDVLRCLDTFLAANWQAYTDFAHDVVHKVLLQEADSAARATAQQAAVLLVLQLLQCLTGFWPPPGLHHLALQLLAGTHAPQHLPTAESVSAPAAILAALQPRRHAANAAARAAEQAKAATASLGNSTVPAAAVAGIPTSRIDAQAVAVQRQAQVVSHQGGDAAAVVAELLQLLPACGVGSWQQLAAVQGGAAAGAGLAALYGDCLQDTSGQSKATAVAQPGDPVATMQLASAWCCAMVAASGNHVLGALKAVALLQLAAVHAQQLQQGAAAGLHDTCGTATPMGDAQLQVPAGLMQVLRPCVELLAGIISHAPLQALRSQAALGLQLLLQGLPGPARYGCLQQLLSQGGQGGSGVAGGDGQVHPEVAALLLQEVRLQLANTHSTGVGCFSPLHAMQLVLPWLQQEGPVGWHDATTLPEKANAICAALAVLRLGLLRGAGTGSTGGTSTAESGRASGQQLSELLHPLAGAVVDALKQLEVDYGAGGGMGQTVQQQTGFQGSSGHDDGRRCIPGEACGEGQAVDAWLAVSRMQDVLARVLELLPQSPH